MSEAEVLTRSRVVFDDDDPDIRALVAIAVTRAGLALVAVTEDGDAATRTLRARSGERLTP